MKDDNVISSVILLLLLLIISIILVNVKVNENKKLEKQYNELITENEILNETINLKDLRIEQLERTLKRYIEDEYINEKLLHYLIEYSDTNIEDFELWLYLNHKEWYLENFNK